jgi:hypothetical protein
VTVLDRINGASPKLSCPTPANFSRFSRSRFSRSSRCAFFLASFSAFLRAFSAFLALFFSDASCCTTGFFFSFLGGP